MNAGQFGDVQTVPEGGLCSDRDNDFGAFLIFTEEWTEYILPFERQRQQGGWGQRFDALRSDAHLPSAVSGAPS